MRAIDDHVPTHAPGRSEGRQRHSQAAKTVSAMGISFCSKHSLMKDRPPKLKPLCTDCRAELGRTVDRRGQ